MERSVSGQDWGITTGGGVERGLQALRQKHTCDENHLFFNGDHDIYLWTFFLYVREKFFLYQFYPDFNLIFSLINDHYLM
jgi:hypothetical protein